MSAEPWFLFDGELPAPLRPFLFQCRPVVFKGRCPRKWKKRLKKLGLYSSSKQMTETFA